MFCKQNDYFFFVESLQHDRVRPQNNLFGQMYAQSGHCGSVENARARHAASPHIDVRGGKLERSRRSDQDHAQGRAAQRRTARGRSVHTQKNHGRDRRTRPFSHR